MSFVLVSPSTLSWFHVRAAAGRRSSWRSGGSTLASVRRTASIVAIRGWIIPTPLAMPVTRVERTASPSRSGRVRVVVAALVRESVVRSASAAAASPASVAASDGASALIPGPTRSSGSRVPMIPVESRSVRSTVDPERRREHRRDLGLVRVARGTGRRVGAAARRDDRLGPAAARREMGLRQAHRRGRERVRGEDGGRGRGDRPAGLVGQRRDDREIRPARGLDPDRGATGPEPGRDRRPPLDRREGGRQRGQRVGRGERHRSRPTAPAGAVRARPSRRGRGRC